VNEPGRTPLLTELRFAPRLAWLVGTLGGGFVLGLTAAFAGVITTYLARRGCADCFCVVLSHGSTTHKIVFGYLAELNHGPFQMLGVLLLLPLAGWLVEMVNDELKVLSARGRFFRWAAAGRPEPYPEGVVEIGNLNRRWFIWLAPLAFLIALAVVSLESLQYDAQHVGWVQAEFFESWSRAKSLDTLGNENFRKAAMERLLAVQEEKTKNRGNASQTAQMRPAISIVPKPKDIQASVLRREPGSQRTGWTRPFVVVALALQALSVGYFIWLGFKLLFLFGLVYHMVRACRIAAETDEAFLAQLATCPEMDDHDTTKKMPNSANTPENVAAPESGVRRTGLLLVVDCFDKKERFGLKVFDRIYDLALVLLTIGATTLLLGALANLPRGTGLLEGGFFVMLLVSVPSLGIVLAPAILLNKQTLDVCAKVRERLSKLIAPGSTVSTKCQKCLDLAEEQTAWPRGDWLFKVLGLAIVMLFIIWGTLNLGIKGVEADAFSKLVFAIAEGLPQRLCQICD